MVTLLLLLVLLCFVPAQTDSHHTPDNASLYTGKCKRRDQKSDHSFTHPASTPACPTST